MKYVDKSCDPYSEKLRELLKSYLESWGIFENIDLSDIGNGETSFLICGSDPTLRYSITLTLKPEFENMFNERTYATIYHKLTRYLEHYNNHFEIDEENDLILKKNEGNEEICIDAYHVDHKYIEAIRKSFKINHKYDNEIIEPDIFEENESDNEDLE